MYTQADGDSEEMGMKAVTGWWKDGDKCSGNGVTIKYSYSSLRQCSLTEAMVNQRYTDVTRGAQVTPVSLQQ